MKKAYLLLAVIAAFISFNAFMPQLPGYQVGEKVKDIKLKNVDNKMISLADYKDAKGFIVIFTCNHCPFAKAYEDRIIALHNKYADNGFPVVAINPNDESAEPEDSFDNMVKRAKEKNYPFAYLYDQTQYYAKTYGATRTPHVFVLSKKSNDLTVEYIGSIDDNTDDPDAVKTKYVEKAVEELLAGKKVTTSFTKAIGCGIKWKKA